MQMIIANRWKDYEVLDCSNGEKLERWGEHILIRPDPQIIWNTEKKNPGWARPAGHYLRSRSGGGEWTFSNLPEQWNISYMLPLTNRTPKERTLVFHLKPFRFKHTGLFPEQAANWDFFSTVISDAVQKRKTVRVLNLFAYTGGATLAAAASGAHVTHVDASKGMVGWAKENAESSNLSSAPIRWLVDDCVKFVQREIRRGNHYDAVIMDPPSYGRGPKGEIWKIEDAVYPLIRDCTLLLSDDPLFFLINSYTTGLQASVLRYMLDSLITSSRGGHAVADEIGLPVSENGLVLPCGASGRWLCSE